MYKSRKKDHFEKEDFLAFGKCPSNSFIELSPFKVHIEMPENMKLNEDDNEHWWVKINFHTVDEENGFFLVDSVHILVQSIKV